MIRPTSALILCVVSLASAMAPSSAAPPAQKVLAPAVMVEMVRTPSREGGSGKPGQVTQDADGEIWGVEGMKQGPDHARVSHWTGDAWDKTPVVMPRHPQWMARPAPPWTYLPERPVLVPGTDGSLLVVTVRDVYQDVATHGVGDKDDWRGTLQKGTKLARERGRYWWLEGALHRDGKWIGPLPIEQLLRQEFAALAKGFQRRTHVHDFFDLHSDGVRLWAGYDGAVWIYDGRAEPRRIVVTPPQDTARDDERGPRGPSLIGLVPRPGGALWCTSPDAAHVTELRLNEDTPATRPLPDTGLTLTYDPKRLRLHSPPGDELWASVLPWNNTLDELVYLWRAGKWTRQMDLGAFQFEGRDGSLWFEPPDDARHTPGANGYRRLIAGRFDRVLRFDGVKYAKLTTRAHPAGGVEVIVASCTSYLAESADGDPVERRPPLSAAVVFVPPSRAGAEPRILRTYGFGQWLGEVGLFLDNYGNVVQGTFFGKLPDPMPR